MSDRHELLIPTDRRPLALALLDRWLDSLRLSRTLPDAVLAADRLAGLTPPAVTPGPEHGPFLSRAAEGAAFAATCTRLARLAGRDLLEGLAAMAADLASHAAGFWGRGDARSSFADSSFADSLIPWAELLRLSRAAGEALAASPAASGRTRPRPLPGTPVAAGDWTAQARRSSEI